MSQMMPVPLADAGDAETFGGKAGQLAVAVKAGLPVPDGSALSWRLVDAIAAGGAPGVLARAVDRLGDFLAVRSSAVGEDAEAASFAGQHDSFLHVPLAGLVDAVAAVRRSVHGACARAYREAAGVGGVPRAGVVIQRMVDAEVAGVAFRPNPVSGADEVVVECAWGLGEAVVGGLVIPEQVRLSPGGEILERRPGMKDVVVVPRAGGGTVQQAVAGARTTGWCIDADRLAELCDLVVACGDVFGGPQDVEWAFDGSRLWLLQRRAVTTGT